NTAGAVGNGPSDEPSISADGRFVSFRSAASDLLPAGQDTNAQTDIFVRDLQNNTTKRASADATGPNFTGNPNDFSAEPFTSADASDLVSGDTNGKRDIFVRDMQTGTTTMVSVGAAGALGNGDSDSPSISQDGRYVVFSSESTNLVGNDTNTKRDVFIHDRNT